MLNFAHKAMTFDCPYKEETEASADFCTHNLQHEQLSVVMCGFAIFRPSGLGGWILNWGLLKHLLVVVGVVLCPPLRVFSSCCYLKQVMK